MNWPLITRARHVEALAELRVKLATAEAHAEAAITRADASDMEAERFRTYYERLADDTLMRRGEASGPVHVQPKTEKPGALSMTDRISRGFALVGNAHGAPITGPKDAATS